MGGETNYLDLLTLALTIPDKLMPQTLGECLVYLMCLMVLGTHKLANGWVEKYGIGMFHFMTSSVDL